MGYFSQIGLDTLQKNQNMHSDTLENAFEDECFDELPVPAAEHLPVSLSDNEEKTLPIAKKQKQSGDSEPVCDSGENADMPNQSDDEEEKRRAEHEAAEAKRKAEWEARQEEKKKATQEQIGYIRKTSK